MARNTFVTTGPTRSKLEWEEWLCPFCNTRAVDEGLKAPKGWYRCPACTTATPQHQMNYRVRDILVGPSNAFPSLEMVGSVTSDATTPAILSVGTITAQPGDQLIAQVVGRSAGAVDLTVSVTWGSASVAILPLSEAYSFDSGTAYGQCMRHTVTAHQTAEMTFDFSGTVPEHRAVLVVRLRGVVAPSIEEFADQDDRLGYPDSITPSFTTGGDYIVYLHAQGADVATTPVAWDNHLAPRFRIGTASVVNSVLSSSYPKDVNTLTHMTSGPNVGHGTGFFSFRIQQ